jgi:hypothetical protein
LLLVGPARQRAPLQALARLSIQQHEIIHLFGHLHPSSVVGIHGYGNGSPACDAEPAVVSAGMTGPQHAGTGGFSIVIPTTSITTSQPAKISIVGGKQITGFLLYAENQFGNRMGTFETSACVEPYECKAVGASCGGVPLGTITHTSASPKGPITDFSFTSDSPGMVVFSAVVVVTKRDWYIITNNVTSVGEPSSSSASAGRVGFNSIVAKPYPLFVLFQQRPLQALWVVWWAV